VAGRRLWPVDADGDTLLVVQIESRTAVESASEILSTPGVGIGLPGQKDLRASYGGDEGAVQAAVDAVRAASHGLGLACGVTAGPDDVAERLEQGFRFVIATPPEAVTVGRSIKGDWTS
jgi:2-dehydro-3-deoxyglucarate aldolase/4-hydroxy-2-oxoheptanedioate aldolase